MLEIDGDDGGGQVVRTAVALSALTGEAVRVTEVRGDRPEPGMRPQHVAAVEAAAALCSATVDGASEGADDLVFRPDAVRATDVAVDVGTAGSVALVLDAVLPLATALSAPATVTVTGGTDVEWAPPIDYLRRVKLPLLAAFGFDAELSVESRGFYPLGGGEVTLRLRPSSPEPVAVADRGALRRVEVHSVADGRLADAEVAERQAAAAAEAIEAAPVGTETTYADADCAGSSVVLVAVYEGSRAGFTALGEAGRPSEAVAADAVEAFRRFDGGDAAVDRHLADQLQLPLALAGGEATAPEATAHVETNRSVVAAFGNDPVVERRDGGVRLSGPGSGSGSG
ncbi:RNA 3'-terminal phosphate cyclase [Halobacteriales archaeon QS_8_69_73]|nr:MAG: RNA 3'-terminal phosphate cyclase [Halobacteriales archaeon QS_8_69_73]